MRSARSIWWQAAENPRHPGRCFADAVGSDTRTMPGGQVLVRAEFNMIDQSRRKPHSESPQ